MHKVIRQISKNGKCLCVHATSSSMETKQVSPRPFSVDNGKRSHWVIMDGKWPCKDMAREWPMSKKE